jgi:dTDP-4-dehydrorhamnose reductase
LRTSWVFGQGGKNFVSVFLDKIKKEPTIAIATDQIGKITWADDLAHAILQSLPLQGVFHFANEGAVTRYTVAEEILSQLNLKKELRATTSAHFPSRAKRPLYSVLNTNKIGRVLPFPPRSWREALKEYLVNAV